MRAFLFLLACAVTAAWSQVPAERFPEFALRDQSDRPRTLADIRGPKGAMLVFYRSADW